MRLDERTSSEEQHNVEVLSTRIKNNIEDKTNIMFPLQVTVFKVLKKYLFSSPILAIISSSSGEERPLVSFVDFVAGSQETLSLL